VSLSAKETSSNPSKDSWIFDSGATYHLTGNKEAFMTYEPLVPPKSIFAANGGIMKAIGIGNVVLKTLTDGRTITLTLSGVLHIPTSSSNLVSMGMLQQKGVTFVAKGGTS
jgi:hypothetical protein